MIGLSRHYVIYDEHDQKDLIKESLSELNLDDKKFKPGVLLGLTGWPSTRSRSTARQAQWLEVLVVPLTSREWPVFRQEIRTE